MSRTWRNRSRRRTKDSTPQLGGKRSNGQIRRNGPMIEEVYDGRLRLGRVRDFGNVCSAELVDGIKLGEFPNPAKAVDAILAATRGTTAAAE